MLLTEMKSLYGLEYASIHLRMGTEQGVPLLHFGEPEGGETPPEQSNPDATTRKQTFELLG